MKTMHASFTIRQFISLAVTTFCNTWAQANLAKVWNPDNPKLCAKIQQILVEGLVKAAELTVSELNNKLGHRSTANHMKPMH